eukprot:gene7857-16079_t
MANRDEIIKQNIAFMYGRNAETSLQDPDKRSFIATRKKTDVDCIDHFAEDFAFLSPSFESKVFVHDETEPYPTFEHAMQASKTTDPVKKNAIRCCSDVREAKKLGSKLVIGKEWHENCSKIAEGILRDKFQRHKELRQKLIKTEHRTLKFKNTYGDLVWGLNDAGKGENRLGKLLEKVRADIENGVDLELWISDHFKPVSPEKVSIRIEVEKDGQLVAEDCKTENRKSVLYIGKSDQCDVVLGHPSSSRRHALLIIDVNRGSLLVDLHSQNGTEIDGRTVTPYEPVLISNSSVVSFAASKRRYRFEVDLTAEVKERGSLYAKMADIDPNVDKAKEAALTVFVGNIPFEATEADLRQFFNGCGNITKLKVVQDHVSGQSKGIAFVTFESQSVLLQALSRDNDELHGRQLKVRRSDSQTARGGSGGGSGSGVGGGNDDRSKDTSKNKDTIKNMDNKDQHSSFSDNKYGPKVWGALPPPPPPRDMDDRGRGRGREEGGSSDRRLPNSCDKKEQQRNSDVCREGGSDERLRRQGQQQQPRGRRLSRSRSVSPEHRRSVGRRHSPVREGKSSGRRRDRSASSEDSRSPSPSPLPRQESRRQHRRDRSRSRSSSCSGSSPSPPRKRKVY